MELNGPFVKETIYGTGHARVISDAILRVLFIRIHSNPVSITIFKKIKLFAQSCAKLALRIAWSRAYFSEVLDNIC